MDVDRLNKELRDLLRSNEPDKAHAKISEWRKWVSGLILGECLDADITDRPGFHFSLVAQGYECWVAALDGKKLGSLVPRGLGLYVLYEGVYHTNNLGMLTPALHLGYLTFSEAGVLSPGPRFPGVPDKESLFEAPFQLPDAWEYHMELENIRLLQTLGYGEGGQRATA